MPNEFKIKNGLVVDSGGAQVTGSLNTTGSLNITGPVTSSGIISIGRSTTSQAVIQRAQTPGGSYSFILASGTGVVDTFPYTMTDAHGATLEMRAGDPTSDQYGGGILITTNGNTSPLGEGNAIVFKTRTGSNTYAERMRITHDGNVGINISPTAKLHVSGTVRIDDQSGEPTTGATPSAGTVNKYWGIADGDFLSSPTIWLKINLNGSDYYFPGYE
jgi:hypothetical protein